MAFKATDFADDTDFERFALDRLGPHRVRVGEPGAIYHDEANPAGGGHASISIGESGDRAREELRQSLRPLGFGAAYKIVDMLVEHVLRANGVRPGRLTFKEKSRDLRKRPATRPVPVDARPDLWDRIAALYRALQDARNAVIHGRAQATANGDLEVYDDKSVLATISCAELAAFAAAVAALAEAVVDVDSDPRRVNIVAWHLNTLRARHGLPSLSATDPDAGRRLLIADLIPRDEGLVRFNLERAREIVAGQPPALWDLELRAGGRVFVGRWEDVPNGDETEIDFHPASPAAWLSEQAI